MSGERAKRAASRLCPDIGGMGAVPPTGLIVQPKLAGECRGIPWTTRRHQWLANEVGENQRVFK